MNNTNVRYAKYNVKRGEYTLGTVEFPSDVRNANFGDVCFYDPVSDTFLGTTEVNGFVVERVA